MPRNLKRYQQNGDLHFITVSCHQRRPLLADPEARHKFMQVLEQVRRWYGPVIHGYVVMPEHVHLLLCEPARGTLATALQMLKQRVALKLRPADGTRFWTTRYYDFNVLTNKKRIEKLRYMHRNPVKRGLVEKPEDWEWSSFRYYALGAEGTVKIGYDLPTEARPPSPR